MRRSKRLWCARDADNYPDDDDADVEGQVNRLTRELTALRAQSASVASNASLSSTSTSASLLPVDISDPNPTHQLTGATHPTPSRRHRSSSSLSNRSIPTLSTGISNSVGSLAHGPASVPVGGVSQASADRAAAATGANPLSRQGSISASGTSTPARQSLDTARHGTSHTLPHRPSLSRDPSYASTMNAASAAAPAGTPAPHSAASPPQQSPSASVHAAMQHYADTAAYRSEMEIVKAENEALRQRVRALERALRARRRDSSQSDAPRSDLRRTSSAGTREGGPALASPTASATGAGVAAWAATDGGVGGVAPPRERSESQSTTASSRRGPNNVNEDDVRVGESAQSAGYQRGL